MLKRLAMLTALVSASTTAWADARSECANSKTPPDQSIATCSEVIRSDARAAWAYNNRGLAYYKKTDYDRAIADYNTVIQIDPKYAVAYYNRGLAYYKKTDYDRAIADYKRSLAIREKALGPDHPDVAQSLGNVASLYEVLGRYADAEPLYKRALAIREKALGPDHPDVAQSLGNLAYVYQVQVRYADAEPLYKRALAIREKALGPDHPDVAQSLGNLACAIPSTGSLRRRRAAVQARAGDPRKGAGARSSRCGSKPQQPGDRVPSPGPLRRRRAAATSARWRSAKRRWALIIPMWLQASTTWRTCTEPRAAPPTPSRCSNAHWRSSKRRWALIIPSVARSLNNLAIVYRSPGPHRRGRAAVQTLTGDLRKGAGP